MSIFRSAMLLTAVNLLLRLAGTSFQVFLSASIGPAGIGLLQLTMSVGSLAMVAGIGGIRTATMYLTAGELGKKRPENIRWILSGCFLYSLLFSGTVALLLHIFSPLIAEKWIGDLRVVPALRLFAAFLPCSCLCGVMTGYFTAAKRIGTLAAVEVAEQLSSMALTMAMLVLWAKQDPGRACLSVVLGSSLGACLTLVCLIILRLMEKPPEGPRISVRRELYRTALPLAAADNLRTGISTVENLMVPKRLRLNTSIADPMAAFGLVNGMVFPVLMFPACIIFGLAELLIPELARCHASGSTGRINYLVRRSLKVSMLYGIFFGGLMFLLSEYLGNRLYALPEVGKYLRLYALLIPILYCDAITDAMIKGMGQQAVSVRYNILTNTLDLIFLYLLLPRYGMTGYFISFTATHMVNFILSLRRLLIITNQRVPAHVPLLSLSACIISCWAVSHAGGTFFRLLFFPPLLVSLLFLLGVIQREDFQWLNGLIQKNDPP